MKRIIIVVGVAFLIVFTACSNSNKHGLPEGFIEYYTDEDIDLVVYRDDRDVGFVGISKTLVSTETKKYVMSPPLDHFFIIFYKDKEYSLISFIQEDIVSDEYLLEIGFDDALGIHLLETE